MTVVTPINIVDDVIIDYAVTTSTDANLEEYDSTKTTYVLMDEVQVASEKKKYKLAAETVAAGVIPKDNPTIWIESPLVEFAMFQYNNEYASTFEGGFSCTITNANDIDTLFFQDFDGEKIKVEIIDFNDLITDTYEQDIYDWQITNFGEYLFPTAPILERKIQFNFVNPSIKSIKVTITGVNTKCRYLVAGYKESIGCTLANGVGYTQNNFYKSSRDAWGNMIETADRLIEDVTLPVIDKTEDSNRMANKTSRLLSSPHLFIADDREIKDVEFNFINIFGVLVSNNISPMSSITQKTLKIEGK